MIHLKLIERLLIKHDPQGLLKMGAPKDEYSSEAEMIAVQLSDCKSAHDIKELIYAVFIIQFSFKTAGGIQNYWSIAHDIWKGIKEKGNIMGANNLRQNI